MLQLSWRIFFLLSLSLQSFVLGEQDEEENKNDPGLFRFVSRPDLTPTKWNITTYHEDRLAPGYWFSGPYRILNDPTQGKRWVGPHIYDQKGELVWSGAKMFSIGDTEDFRVSNVNGENLLTVMDQGRTEAIVLDEHYEVRNAVKVDHFNSHELHYVDNGTRALVIKGNPQYATREMAEAIGYEGDDCVILYDRFVELDVLNNYEILYDWSSFGHFGLEESTYNIHNSPEERCSGHPWDAFHTNSLDKTANGDYLYSSRHTNTIYKISKDDGSIIWRLGGIKSDFTLEGDYIFTRQHDIRVREENGTHLIVTFLDNAKGQDPIPKSNEFSRGLKLALDEEAMTASIIRQYDHPLTEDRISSRRGNYQILPNNNVFMGWSEQGCQSEHDEDGTILQEAIFGVKWLGTYRQYKFPWVGRPKTPPDVHSEAFNMENGDIETVVHVSWNGATEVHSWNAYSTSGSGRRKVLFTSATKSGFETKLSKDGYQKYILVEALDKDRQVIGTSDVIETIVGDDVKIPSESGDKDWHDLIPGALSPSNNATASFFFGFIFTICLLLGGYYLRRRGLFRVFRASRYQRLRHAKEDPHYQDLAEEYDEQSVPLQESRKQSLDER